MAENHPFSPHPSYEIISIGMSYIHEMSPPNDQSAPSHLQAQLVGWEQIRMGLEHAQAFSLNGFPDAKVEIIELGECKVTLRTVRELEEYLQSKLRRELLASVGNHTLTLKEAEARIMMAQSTVANEDVVGRIVLK